MAQETLDVQRASRLGEEIDIQNVTTADGFRFKNDGRTVLIVSNDAGALQLAFTPTQQVDSLDVETRTVTVAASEMWVLGPWPKQIYNDTDGYLDVAINADLATVYGVAPVRL